MEDAITTSTRERFSTKPSFTVVDRIADLEETSPIELPPLYAAIDPEALDSLFDVSSAGTSGSVQQLSFTYCDYEVCVRSDRDITITAL